MRTTTAGADHDDVVDLVTRTLRAVAEATPVADEQAAAPVAHDLLPLAGSRRHGPGRRPSRARLLAVAAAAAAVVAVVATAVGDGGGGGQVDTTPAGPPGSTALRPAIRMEAGWLPAGFEDAPAVVERSPGLDVPVEATLWGAGDEAVVAAAIDLGDGEGDRNKVRRRTEAVRGALEGAFRPPDSGHMATATAASGERGGTALARGGASVDVEAIAARIADGASPAAAWPDRGTPTAVSLGWLPRVGASVTVGYQTTDQTGAVAITATSGRLPEASLAQEFLPDATPIDVRGRSGWSVVPAGSDDTWVTWQEEPGLVVTVAGGLPHDELLTVAEGLVPVDEPADGAEAAREVVDEGTIEGLDYRIERSSGDDTGRGWCASVVVDGDAAGRPLCQHLVDGRTASPIELFPVAEVDGGALWWGSAPAGTATVSVEGAGDSPVETVEVVADGDGSLPVALVVVPDDLGSPTFVFHGPDGELLGTSRYSGEVPFG